MLTNKIKDLIKNLSVEFDEKEGLVACEFSIPRYNIESMREFVKNNVDLKFGKWVITECEACREYHGSSYVHACIEKNDFIGAIKKEDYFITTF